MGSPPLPPHERTWRHPSELAAAERHAIRISEPQRSTRAFAIATGSVGLVALGLLMLTVTPRKHESPIAIGTATTSPVVTVATLASLTPVAVMSDQPDGESGVSAAAHPTRWALATPIGDGDFALLTLSGLARQLGTELGTELDVLLTTGQVVTAVVDTATSGVAGSAASGIVLVWTGSGGGGHPIADDTPNPDEIVTVLADPPVTVPFSAVDTIDAEEGTPVLDSDGELIGLCTEDIVSGDGSIDLIDVTDFPALDERLAVATSAAP